MAVVYWDYMRKRFTAPRMSWAWILKVIAWLVIIILPFFLAYWSHCTSLNARPLKASKRGEKPVQNFECQIRHRVYSVCPLPSSYFNHFFLLQPCPNH